MKPMDRREMLKVAAVAPVASALSWTRVEAEQAGLSAVAARRAAAAAGHAYQPQFFNAHEWDTVRVLSDMILPADERSGSATDAGVPEFIDFMMTDRPDMQIAVRGGLAWLDSESRDRSGATVVAATDAQRGAILDDIAWPARARPEHSHGVAFFNRFRDLVATGFWSSRMGVDDLGYIGNVVNPAWDGCPPEAVRKLLDD